MHTTVVEGENAAEAMNRGLNKIALGQVKADVVSATPLDDGDSEGPDRTVSERAPNQI